MADPHPESQGGLLESPYLIAFLHSEQLADQNIRVNDIKISHKIVFFLYGDPTK